MKEDILDINKVSGDEYMHDLKLKRDHNFVEIPNSMVPGSGYREAESAYIFNGKDIKPFFKRWSRQRMAPEVYNGGFEDMESMGAVYSRISTYIMGDWNACGKVMGLAPWASRSKYKAKTWLFENDDVERLNINSKAYQKSEFMTGSPYPLGLFTINWDQFRDLDPPGQLCLENFGKYANIADSIQSNLETCALSMISALKDQSLTKNVALVGGVALNSVLNGRISREYGFENVFIPPAPGDEGVAVGCALYGLHQLRNGPTYPRNASLEVKQTLFSAYQGKKYSTEDIEEIIDDLIPWLLIEKFDDYDDVITRAVQELADGVGLIAWYSGRSEFGQRALGNRSFIADPRREELRKFINEVVKGREWYRPLAPSCLSEEAGNWFEGVFNNGNESPFMSITTKVREEKRSQVPAICHIDGTARLQTVATSDNSYYHRLIEAFRRRTGIPMVLNTSFNKRSQPIVESPLDAIVTFLQCKGNVESLFMDKWELKRRPFPLSDMYDHPSETDCGVTIFAKVFYLSETTFSPLVPNTPLRIRIQDGRDHLNCEENEFVSDSWKELPSVLHLDILQLLQPNVKGGEAGGLRITDLLDLIGQWNGEEDRSWRNIRMALKWLYEETLVYFE